MKKVTESLVFLRVSQAAASFVRCLARGGTPFLVSLFVVTVVAAGIFLPLDSACARLRRVPSEYKTIQKAIDLAEVGDTLLVGPGVYKENLLLRKAASLIGVAGASKTIIDAGRRGVALTCDQVDSTATIQGFTFKNGVGLHGGGLFLSSSFPRVIGNVFTADSAKYGGALCALWSNSVIKNNKFVGNAAEYGGAIYTMFISPTIDSNLVENNRAKLAGGLYFAKSSEAKVRGNTIVGNRAETGGGAFLNRAAPLLEGNVFKANKAEQGGGVCARQAGGLIKDNVFCDNVGSRGAALAFVDTIGPDVRGNTIVRNSAPDSLCAGIYFLTTYMNVANNIIAHNSPGYAVYCLSGATPVLSCNIMWDNATGDYSGVVSETAEVREDPLFCAPEKDDFSVREGSPALSKDCGNIGAKGQGCGAVKRAR
ncbi:MAG: right-handed parallel beta-helix repeat-containing protein [Candidatus Eisenbacteria bacterium]|nr:right-handed parallel beta-helix repeat-containing protein [Candidatus Eisenbacteria bacterium]